MARLKGLLQCWQTLENRLEQLQGDLREDEQTLVLLDSALQGGTFSNQMASVVRDVAKLLSETKANQQVSYFFYIPLLCNGVLDLDRKLLI